MAKAPPSKAKDKKTKKKSGGKLKTILFLIVFGAATPIVLPTVILLIAGLIPTYVALGTDSDEGKSGAICVGALNIAGITPFLIDLWIKGQTIENVFAILSSPNNWLVILGAAGIGQLIAYAVPQAIATLTLTHSESRIKSLKQNLEMLKESWGPEVATVKVVDSVTQE
jgi:hypothetical protein